MAVINILSPHVADMIAAGEVVERPSSVVKELMENAADAGAKHITVEIEGSGATCVRVTDDGCGMAPEDAGNCFLRHATSKLKDERGLEAISTMGFRGEALAAISAVSRVTLTTRRAEDAEGTLVEVTAGDIQAVKPWGGPVGTTFTVRDLFFNTPARLKFMKSDRAEAAHCVNLALKVALGRPDISVRCIRDGKEEFFTPGDGKAESAVYSLLGREIALSMLPIAGENEGVSVHGFISAPAAGRGNRAQEHFFVNGRAIRSATLQAAVEQAYKNNLLVGRFPACVVYIEVSPGAVDVNVHPTKSEVKFSGEKRVFDAVHYSAVNALAGRAKPMEMTLSKGTEKKLAPVPAEMQETAEKPAPKPYAMPGITREGKSVERPSLQVNSPAPSYGGRSVGTSYRPAPRPDWLKTPGFTPEKPKAVSAVPVREPRVRETPVRETSVPRAEQLPITEAAEPVVPMKAVGEEKARLVGEVLHTYILAEKGESVYLIDKHAAHERMNFDRLKAMGHEVMSQTLLIPETWRPTREDRETVEENGAVLEKLGFRVEPFGEEDLIVRGVPEGMDPAQTVPALEEIAQKLARGGGDLARDEILQTISCKGAIKAGWDTDPAELQVLVDKVVSGEIRYCPHGRPVAVVLTRKELDRQFKRIV